MQTALAKVTNYHLVVSDDVNLKLNSGLIFQQHAFHLLFLESLFPSLPCFPALSPLRLSLHC